MRAKLSKGETTAADATCGGGPGRTVSVGRARGLIFLVFALCFPAAGQTTDPYGDLLDRQFAEKPEAPGAAGFKLVRKTAAEWRAYDLETAIKREAQRMAQGPLVETPPPVSHNSLALGLALLLAAVAGLGKLVDVFSRRFRFRAESDDRWQNLLIEDPSLAAFFTELRDGLSASPSYRLSEDSLGVRPQTSEDIAADPLREFFAAAPGQVANLRSLFSEISRAADETARQNVLLEFHRQVSDLKDLAQLPEVSPFGLVAYALAGLLKQLSCNAPEVTPSVLRTVAGAVDLLEALCVRSLNPNLATEPPVRLLAVDDDAVSRLAISFALKKAFNEPDLAPDGEEALDLIARQSYDVIFLDVDMPGMDGYELCTKIRQTAGHRTTPVVFVTRHSDFNSRAKSTLSGGQDLIGKPFLAFEITVKALTLALRGRLQNDAMESRSASAAASDRPAAVLPAVASAAMAPSAEPVAACRESELNPAASSHPNGHRVTALVKASGDDSPDAFFSHTSVYLEQLRNHLQAAQRAAEPAELQKLLGELFLGVRSLSLEAEQAELRTVSRLSAALEGMLKKLVEHTKLCTPSTLAAAAAALDLLDDLCWTGFNPDLANPPVRLLVVDDDPVARRAVCGSLQLAFGRPESAESGEAALALAAEKTFDLIFLDVLMPGMDGYTTCKRVHEAAPNRGTPVVFVTSHDDMEARAQANDSGGCGFIPKPVLASQIALIALTFILRARLAKCEPATVMEESDCLEMA